MGDAALRDFLSSGRKLLQDTKAPRRALEKKTKVQDALTGEVKETDPHKVFIKRTIQEKPKKAEVITEFKKFIEQAEALL
jgi:hypothetical protein